jgi:putative spermidine/putrescine transport system substrate-binding protein
MDEMNTRAPKLAPVPTRPPRLSRRHWLHGAGAGAAAALATAAVPARRARAQGKGEVVICGWGGSLQEAERKAFFQPFERETGIRVTETSPTNYGKLKAMVDSGNVEWDVVDAGDRHLFAGIQDNLLEKLDYAAINTKDFLPSAVNAHGLGIFYWSTNICRSLRGGDRKSPKSWADFYSVKDFPGARAMRSTAFDNMEIALMADGVALDKVYPLTPEKIDRAYKVLERIKPHVTKWWKVEAQAIQMLTDGEVDFAVGPGGRVAVVRRQGAKVAFEWNQGIVHGDSWVVPRGAKNKKNAMAFIAFASQPERQAEFARQIPYGPLNTKAFQHLSRDEAAQLPTALDNLKLQLSSDSEWWGKNLNQMEDRWNAWLVR